MTSRGLDMTSRVRRDNGLKVYLLYTYYCCSQTTIKLNLSKSLKSNVMKLREMAI
jgi:hypothetical protein